MLLEAAVGALLLISKERPTWPGSVPSTYDCDGVRIEVVYPPKDGNRAFMTLQGKTYALIPTRIEECGAVWESKKYRKALCSRGGITIFRHVDENGMSKSTSCELLPMSAPGGGPRFGSSRSE